MYIPHHAQQAIHHDVVNDGLWRSERRRMLSELQLQTDTGAKTWRPGTPLASVVRSMLGVAARP